MGAGIQPRERSQIHSPRGAQRRRPRGPREGPLVPFAGDREQGRGRRKRAARRTRSEARPDGSEAFHRRRGRRPAGAGRHGARLREDIPRRMPCLPPAFRRPRAGGGRREEGRLGRREAHVHRRHGRREPVAQDRVRGVRADRGSGAHIRQRPARDGRRSGGEGR